MTENKFGSTIVQVAYVSITPIPDFCTFGYKHALISGAATPHRRPRLDGRIVGGVPVNIEDFPYQVRSRLLQGINIYSNIFHLCRKLRNFFGLWISLSYAFEKIITKSRIGYHIIFSGISLENSVIFSL